MFIEVVAKLDFSVWFYGLENVSSIALLSYLFNINPGSFKKMLRRPGEYFSRCTQEIIYRGKNAKLKTSEFTSSCSHIHPN